MNTSSEDIKDMLIADSSLGLVFANNLFIGLQPEKPDNCVTIYDSPGTPAVVSLDKNFYERPSIQIKVRNIDYNLAMNVANTIKDSLQGRANETWNGTLYALILLSSGPAILDWDELGNINVVMNFNLQRR